MLCIRNCIIISLLAIAPASIAQLTPIGGWTDHLPYGNAMQLALGEGKLWCATAFSVFSVDKSSNEFERWSKVNGLHETGVRSMGWNEAMQSLVIAYNNSNIDIISDGNIYNINAVKNSALEGDRNIYSIFNSGERAYLCTGLGIMVANLEKKEIGDTYIIGNNGAKTKVYEATEANGFLYAATAEGLKRVPSTNANPSDFRNWEQVSGTGGLPNGSATHIGALPNQVLVVVHDSIFSNIAGTWNFLYAGNQLIRSLGTGNGRIIICESANDSGRVTVLSATGIIERRIQQKPFTFHPQQAISDNADFWIADSLAGLSRFDGNSFSSYIPNSPQGPALGTFNLRDGTLWASSASVAPAWAAAGNRDGLYRFANGSWTNFNGDTQPILDTVKDITCVAIDPGNASAWAGSFGGGLINIQTNNQISIYKQGSPVQPDIFAGAGYRVSGLTFDHEQQLWIANYGASEPLLLHKTDGTWKSFPVPFPIADNALSAILPDDLNQLWIIAAKGQGLICYNHGASLESSNDDNWKWYRAGAGNGNLPDNNVLCLAKDKNNFIWVGTAQGIGIIQCPQEVFGQQGCEAILPVVQQDNFAGYLFRDEMVQAIAVDGANRKWVGTRNGVWLISADGDKTIYRFTAENSPLPGDDVRQIAIDGSNGQVYFSTTNGLCSFRSTATESADNQSGVLVFPNPVPPGYTGSIAIRGLADNAIVKITELDGRLVFQTRALGGQAIWNGKNYKGQSAATGVYLVLVRSENGQDKMVTKIVMVKK